MTISSSSRGATLACASLSSPTSAKVPRLRLGRARRSACETRCAAAHAELIVLSQRIAWFPISSLPVSHQTNARNSGTEDAPNAKYFQVAPAVKCVPRCRPAMRA